jgi:preprotein translocase subunit SecE
MLQRQGQTNPDGSPAVATPPRPRGRTQPVEERQSVPVRAMEYMREVRNELVKVAWPGRPEVINYTVVVFATLVLLTSIVFGLDYVFAKGVIFLFSHPGK